MNSLVTSIGSFVPPSSIPNCHIFNIIGFIIRVSPIRQIVDFTRKDIQVFDQSPHPVIIIHIPAFTPIGVKTVSPCPIYFIPLISQKFPIVAKFYCIYIWMILQIIQSFLRVSFKFFIPTFKTSFSRTMPVIIRKNLIVGFNLYPHIFCIFKIKKILVLTNLSVPLSRNNKDANYGR